MKKYIFMVLLAIASIVFASVLVRYSEAGPVATGAYRLLLALPILAGIDYYTPKQASCRLQKSTLVAAAAAGIFFALDLSVFNVSLLFTSLAEATLLTNMVPFVLVPISMFLFKEKISAKFLYAVILALIGLFLLTHDKNLSARHISGDWLALLSAVFYAIFMLCIKKARENYYTGRVMMIVCLVGGLSLLGLAAYKQEQILPSTTFGWLIIAGIVISGQILGQTLLAYAIKFIPVQLASIFLLLSPVFAAIYAYAFFNEVLHFWQLAGIWIILIAVYYAKLILEKSLKKDDF